MKKTVLTMTLLFALPVMANAEENKEAPAAPAKEHHMQNSNPTPAPAEESIQGKHHMKNMAPSPAETSEEKTSKHVMKND